MSLVVESKVPALDPAAWGGTFRSSPAYELVLFDRLPAAEQELLQELRGDPDLYGVLRPLAEGGTLKAVGRETALLLFTLREPGSLPAYVLRSGSEGLAEAGELVLDGVLEVLEGDRFFSGPEAFDLLWGASGPAAGQGTLGRLSEAALRYAEALEPDDASQVAQRLYTFNTLPVTPRWQRRLRSVEAIADLVGLTPGGALPRRLRAEWRARDRRHSQDWLSWERRGGLLGGRSEATFKLYLSPAPEALDQAFGALVEVLAASRATSFKLGGHAADLLRPDKLVVYFRDLESLQETVERLASGLVGIPAHGVPFTAEAAGAGLLSWGLDPPEREQPLAWQEAESWRLWVVRRLAAALVAARRRPPAATPPWRFALERLRLQGIDVDRWIPSPALWRTEA